MDIIKYNILQYAIDKNYLADQLKILYVNYLYIFEKEFGQEKKLYKNLKKTYIVDLMARVFANKNLFLKLLSLLPPDIQEIFKFLTFQNFKYPAKTLEKKFNISLLNETQKYASSTAGYFNTLAYLFSFKVDFGNNKEIYLDQDIVKIIINYFEVPDNYKLIEAVKKPETMYIYTDNGEIINYLPLYLKSVNNIKSYTKGKKILKSIKKNVYEQCGINEFYKDSLSEDWSFIKTELIIHFFMASKIFNKLDNIELLKKLLEQYQDGKFFYTYQLIYHIKNLSRYTGEAYFLDQLTVFNRIFNSNMIELIKNLPLGKWVDYTNFYRAYLLHEDKTFNLFSEHAMESIYYDEELKHYTNKKYINNEQLYLSAVFEPAIKGTFFLFAALGLIDIAYNKPKNELKREDKNYLSIFDGLKYIRLNELGSYILGLTDNYKTDSKLEEIEIKLSELELKITVKGKSKVKTMFMESFAQKINENIYKVDYSIFLKDCSSKKEIKNKIELFKKEICSDLPEIWSEFFKNVLLRGESLDKNEDFILYSLKDKNDLARLFLTDDILKKYSLKVEKMMIAIKKEDVNKVKKRLESLGYIGSII